MKCKRNREIKNSEAAANEHRTERMIISTKAVSQPDKDDTTKNADTDPSDFVDPLLVDRIFYEKGDTQYQNGNPDFVDQIFADEFFNIRIFQQPFLKPMGI